MALCSLAVGCDGSSATRVHLVTAAGSLRDQCRTAARFLGFAVPCPGEVPTQKGQPLGCSRLSIPTQLPPCVGPEHDFWIEWNGFDVPRRFSGVDGRPAGHVIIHAGLAGSSPSNPCIDGVAVGTFKVDGSTGTFYQCPPDSPRIERLARHGEGAYAGHLTLAWRNHGVDYLVSSHGYSPSSRTLIEDLSASISLSQQ
jgi:hypothetical protein